MVKKREYETKVSTPEEAYELYLDTVKDPVEKLIAQCEKEFKTQMKSMFSKVTVTLNEATEEGVVDEVQRVYRGKGWSVTKTKQSLTLERYVQSTGGRD